MEHSPSITVDDFNHSATQITDKPNFGKIAIVDATIHAVTEGTIQNGVITLDGEKLNMLETTAQSE